MNEQEFLAVIHTQATQNGIDPVLLLSGIEGLYTFRNVPPSEINFSLLDSLILTIFALRIGDSFDALARQNIEAPSLQTRMAAERELELLSPEDLAQIGDPFLDSFVAMIDQKLPVRRYHRKALDVAALEIKKAQVRFESNSIGVIILSICQVHLKDYLHLAAVFSR